MLESGKRFFLHFDSPLGAEIAEVRRDRHLQETARTGDNVDFRAMLAREVWSEWAWRVDSVALTPADCVRDELPDLMFSESLAPLNIRTIVENECGEALA